MKVDCSRCEILSCGWGQEYGLVFMLPVFVIATALTVSVTITCPLEGYID